MCIAYFDEVKAMPQNGQEHYLVGGLVVPLDKIAELEKAVTDLAVEVFESSDLVKETEFHASYCYFGKSQFKGMQPARRVEILVRLARLISETDGVKRVYAAINQPKLYSGTKTPEIAFAHFVERVEMAVPNGTPCLLIGDLDDEQATTMVRDFSRFRQKGTPWAYGIELRSVVDSVHFCRSHHSRLLQLADVYMFIVSGRFGSRKGWMKDLMAEGLKNVELWAHRYKEWPK